MPKTIASPLRKDGAIRYDAFISYSQSKDKPIAAALQFAMQKLGKAWYQRRALKIFRDDTSVAATPQLWPTIEKALAHSRYLVVLASPQFAASKWCGMEIAYWLKHKSTETLLVAVTEGELAWDDDGRDFHWNAATPLPLCLKGQFGHEPKWINLRPFREHPDARDAALIEASAEFAAAVHGIPKEDLISQEIQQQKRALRLAWLVAAALLMLTGAASWQWAEAVAQRREAEIQRADAVLQRDRAEWNLEIARKTAQDLIFKIAQELQFVEGMRIEGIEQVLETVRATMDKLVRSAPNDVRLQEMRSAMFDEFAKTYSDAGDHDRALAAAEEALAIDRKLAAELDDPRVQINLSNALNRTGEIHRDRGNRPGALEAFAQSLAVMRALLASDPTNPRWQRGTGIAVTRIGDIRLEEKRLAEAIEAYEEGLALMRKVTGADPDNLDRQRDLTISLNKVGETKLKLRDDSAALSIFEESLKIRRRMVLAYPLASDFQRDLGKSLMYVADIYYRRGQKQQALASYEECLTIRRRLASMNPSNVEFQKDLSIVLGELGEIWRQEGRQSAAIALWEESVDIQRKLAHGRKTEFLSRGLFMLALAVAAVDVPRARTLLQEAIMIAEELNREHSGGFQGLLRALRDTLSQLSTRKSR